MKIACFRSVKTFFKTLKGTVMNTLKKGFERISVSLLLGLFSLSMFTCTRSGRSGRQEDLLPDDFPKPDSRSPNLATGETWGREFDLFGEEIPEPGDYPLQVIHHSPERHVAGASAVLVTFSQPMIRLGKVKDYDEDPSRYPIRIQPPVEGNYRWVAGDTLKVELKKPFKNAHEYKVTIPAGTSSLTGARLKEGFSWSFQTPRPELRWVRVLPEDEIRADRIRPGDRFEVFFNMTMDPESIKNHVVLEENNKPIPYSVEVQKAERGRPANGSFVLIPKRPLKKSAQVMVKAYKGMISPEGPLGSDRQYARSYNVYGPLSVSMSCDGTDLKNRGTCYPMNNEYHRGIVLEFTEPVTLDQVVKNIRFEPQVKYLRKKLHTYENECGHMSDNPCAMRWELRGALEARRNYRISAQNSIRDIFGQRLAKPFSLAFKTTDYPPGIFTPREEEGFREHWHPYRISTVNTRTVEIRRQSFQGESLIRFLVCVRTNRSDWPNRCWNPPEKPEAVLKTGGKRKNAITQHTVDLLQGINALQLSSPEVVEEDGEKVPFFRLAIRTNLGIHGRLSPYGLVAWITTLENGDAVNDALVTVFDENGEKLAEKHTDQNGLVEFHDDRKLTSLTASEKLDLLYVHVQKGNDEAYLGIHKSPRRWGHWSHHSGRSTEPFRYCNRHDCPEALNPDFDRYQPNECYLGCSREWRGIRPRLVGYVASERGIYRPGHNIHVHGAIREFRESAGTPFAGKAVTVELTGPDGAVVQSIEARTGKLGVFMSEFRIPAQTRLGHHQLRLKYGEEILDFHNLRVEEYRAPQFEVLMSMTPDRITRRKELLIKAGARYFFGGSLGGAAYRLSVTRTPTTIHPMEFRGFFAGSAFHMSPAERTKTWFRKEGVLSNKGAMTERLDLSEHLETHFPWPAYHTAELEVTCSAQRSVAARKSSYQSPGRFYPAVRTVPGEKNRVRRKILVLERLGKTWTARGGRVVDAKVYSEDGFTAGTPGRVLWERKLTVPEGGSVLNIPWPRDYKGYSLLLVLSVRDEKGREVRTADRVYRPDEWTRKWQKDEEARKKKQAQLTIETDKEEYLPGDTAVVTVTRRDISGEAMLFVEREKVFSSHPLRFDSSGRAVVQIPVEAWMAGRVGLRALAVRARDELRGEHGPLVSTMKDLRISPKPFTLHVLLETDKKQYRPREKVTVNISVTDGLKRQRESQVVVMAVDESVLRLTGYGLSNPLWKLLHTPADQVAADDLRRYLARLGILEVHRDYVELSSRGFGLSGGGVGGGGGLGGAGRASAAMGVVAESAGDSARRRETRRLFETTPWHTTLVTDSEGKAQASFTLPDNLTDYRLMAFALDNERSSGTGSSNFKVDLPLLTMPSMPRFAREGDEFSGGVTVFNSGLKDGNAVVRARLRGKKLELTGAEEKTVSLVRGRDVRVEFPFKALSAGEAIVEFDVEMGGVRDSAQTRFQVQRATFTEAASVSGRTETAVLQGMEKLSDLRPDYGGLEIQTSSTALVGIEDGMEQLIDYPYGCLEQQSSRLLPLVAMAVMGDRFNLDLGKDLVPRIRETAAAILAMQRSDGGFGYWPSSTRSSPWATAYALIVMKRLELADKVAGRVISPVSLRKAVIYLSRISENTAFLGPYWWSYETFILYALSLHLEHAPGANITGRVLKRFEDRREQPLFARAMLLATMAQLLRRDGQVIETQRAQFMEAKKVLTREISDSLRVDGTWAHAEEQLHRGYQVMMHSNDRTTAMVLLSLLEAEPAHPMIPRLVAWFLQGRQTARFRNTQEAAWALMALWDYARIIEKDVPDFEAGVWMGGKRILSARFSGRSLQPRDERIPMEQLLAVAGRTAQDMVIAKRGTGILYYVARLRYARTRLPETSRNHGFEVRRTFQIMDPAGKPISNRRKPRFGDTVLVTIEVDAKEARRYVVVEDPLPAGLEALDTTLATASRTFGARSIWDGMSYFDHRELRDDRVTFFRDHMQPGTHRYSYLARVTSSGDFITPPTKAEEMYNPEVFGHTPSRVASFR